jgi:hypothetical protein
VSQSLRHNDFERRAPAPDRMVQASGVADRYSITVRTLDRWLQKPALDFPKPVLLMHDVTGRVSMRLWRAGDLVEWERAHAAKHE